jgi:hypothetical protein
MGSSFGHLLCLIYLFLLYSPQRIFRSRVASPCSRCTRYQIGSATALYIPSSRYTISKPVRIETTSGIVHGVLSASVLARAHQLLLSFNSLGVATHCQRVLPFFINNSHSIKIILCQIQMFPRVVFHYFILVIIGR